MAKTKKPCRSIFDSLTLQNRVLFTSCYLRFLKIGDRFRQTRIMHLYTCTVPLLIVAGLAVGTHMIRTSPKYTKYFEEMDNVLMFVCLFNITVAILTFLSNVISMQSKNTQHLHLFDHIDQIDSKLVKEFGVDMCYGKIAYKVSLVIIIFLVYGNSVNFAVNSFWSQGDLLTVYLVTFCHTFILTGMHMIVYGFMTVADLLRIRFRLMQKLLNPEYLKKRYGDSSMVCESKLCRAIAIYRELYEVIDELNGVYGFCMGSCLAHDFTLATSLLFLMFGRSSRLDGSSWMQALFVFLFLLPAAYKMVMMPIYCSMSLNEGKKCIRIVKLMDESFPGNGRIRQIVANALWWNNHNRNHEYKIGSTITANIGLITVMLSAIINYVAILTQFQLQEDVLK